MIAHLDMDAFYVSVELLSKPWLRGKPVVVSGEGPRAVVTTASYEARKFGVGSAIPASRARRLCPDAIFIAPDHESYRRISKEVMARVRAHVPVVEVMGLDEAYLDLSGLVAPRAAMRRLVSEIRAATGLSASVGMGPNKLVAKVASDAEKPRGFLVLTSDQARLRFAAASPRLLPGIGPKTAERLEALGIATVAQLATASAQSLTERFGSRMGPYLISRARFEDDAPVSEERINVSESRETTFDVDISDRGEQEAQLRRLAVQLCAGLAKQDKRGRTIAIKVRLDDFTTVTRAHTLPAATADPDAVSELAVTLLREYAPSRPVRLLGVRVAAFQEPGDVAQDASEQAQLALPV